MISASLAFGGALALALALLEPDDSNGDALQERHRASELKPLPLELAPQLEARLANLPERGAAESEEEERELRAYGGGQGGGGGLGGGRGV